MNSFQRTHYKSNLFKAIIFAFILFMFGSGLTFVFASQNVASAQETSQSSTVAYLHKDWKTKIATANENIIGKVIKSVTFTDTLPTGTALCSVGSTMETDGVTCGVSDYTATDGVSDVLAYVSTDTVDTTLYNIVLYAPCTIYAPTDSTELFSIYYTEYQTSGNSTSVKYFSNITSIDFNGDQFNTSSATNMESFFEHCTTLTSLNIKNFDTSNVEDLSYFFNDCKSLTEIDVSSFVTTKAKGMYWMFHGTAVVSLDLSHFDTSNVENFGSIFSGCSNLKEINLSGFVTSNATSTYSMFWGCEKLESINMHNWDTSGITNMSNMFRNCSSLKTLDIGSFDTSSLSGAEYMFSGCSSLLELDLSNWTTPNITKMNNMFEECISLKSLDISNFDTTKTNTFEHVFYNCSSLDNLNLGKFEDTSVSVNVYEMFYGCSAIKSLDLGSWFLGNNVTSSARMLSNIPNLQSIILPCVLSSDVSISLPVRMYKVDTNEHVSSITIDNCSNAVRKVLLKRGTAFDYDIDNTEFEVNNSENIDFVYFSENSSQEVTLHEPTKRGGIFKEWKLASSSASSSLELNDNKLIIPAAYYPTIIYLEPVFEKIQYEIKFDVDGGQEIDSKSYVIQYIYDQDISLPTPQKTGATFISWVILENTEINDSYLNNSTLVIPQDTYGDIVLKAVWNSIDYAISFVTNNEENVNSLTYNCAENLQEKELQSLQTSESGYCFAGWEITQNSLGESSSVIDNKLIIPGNAYGEIILTAKWELIDYLIIFDVNGGNAVENKNYNISNSTQEILIEIPIKKGYTFINWDISTTSQNTSCFYNDDKLVIPANSYGDIGLKANWVANVYKVTLVLEAGENDWATTRELTFGEAYGELPKPTKEGYVFKGWYLDEAFTQRVTAETIVQIDENHKLYAKWEKPKEKGFFEKTEGMIVLGASGVVLIGLGLGLILAGRRKRTK